jgi:anionic cell wall polymer biosynthesis LytR-Cps2A-Psr (LCP) family protein
MTTVIHPKEPGSLEADAAVAGAPYRPDAEDALTLLVIGAEEAGAPAGSFVVLRFDPVGNKVTVAALPPETVVSLKGREETLYDAYRFGGALYLKDALAGRLNLTIDRYARINREGFILAAEAVGSIEFELEEPVTIKEGAVPVTLKAGLQLLDGRKVAGLISREGLSSQERCRITSALAAAVIGQRIDVVKSTLIDKIFETVINLIDSDITYADYELRKAAAIHMAGSEDFEVREIFITGEWRENGFYLSDTAIAMLGL